MSKSVMVDGVEYLPATKVEGDQAIVVFPHGWVFVGTLVPQEGPGVHLVNAKNIRRWGTTKGLGQLSQGPLTGTVCDEYGDVSGVPLFVIRNVSGW